MSSYEIRAHFLIYRELADGLRGTDLNVADLAQRRKARIELDGNELVNAIAGVAGVDGHDELHPQFWHAIHGLRRRGLLGEDLLVAVRDEANPDLPYEAVVS